VSRLDYARPYPKLLCYGTKAFQHGEYPMTEATLNYDGIVARYTRMRKIGFNLNMALSKCLSQGAIEATARRLGLWQDGTVVFDNEDQSCVMFDQAIHGYFQDGKNAVDRYVDQHPQVPGSDQEAAFAATKRAFHSLFQVQDPVPGVGVHVRDGLYDRRYFLADVGFSNSARKGAVLASRVLQVEDFIMTTGAPLPVDRDALEKITRLAVLKNSSRDLPVMSRQELADVAASVTAATSPSRVGRNAPCPCGSGKKYKKCCINKNR